jgi:hypothetical protein
MGKLFTPLADRFWARVLKTDGCWLWTGHLVKGYGNLSEGGRKGRHLYAHRVSWSLANGQIPAGMNVLHKCDNPKCVRPDHLELGSHAKNLRDAVDRGLINADTQRRTGVVNGRAKITEADVRRIREVYASNQGKRYVKRGTCIALANELEIDPEIVRRIAQRKLWKHIP